MVCSEDVFRSCLGALGVPLITVPDNILNLFFICYLTEIVYDEEGNLLDEKPIDAIEVEKRKKLAVVRNKVED